MIKVEWLAAGGLTNPKQRVNVKLAGVEFASSSNQWEARECCPDQ
jgi:hypothetical protein